MITINGTARIITFEDDVISDSQIAVSSTTTVPFTQSDVWQYDDKNVLKSGSISNSESTNEIFTFELNATGSIEFNYIVSSEYNYDWLSVDLDGTQILHVSGTDKTDFTVFTKSDVAAGKHALTFTYSKDGSGSNGKDAAAIGYIKIIGLVRKRYLFGDGSNNIYTLDGNGALTLLPDAQLTGETFLNQGTSDPPAATVLTQLTDPKIYAWQDYGDATLKAKVTVVPRTQTLTTTADLSDSTIKGIDSMACIHSGDVTVSYSFDNDTWSTEMPIETLTEMDATGYKAIYDSCVGTDDKKLYFKFMLAPSAALTSFTIMYIN